MAHLWTLDVDRSLSELKRAVELNPSNTQAISVLGHTYTLLGQPDEAIRHLERLFLLNPKGSFQTIWQRNMALAHLTAGRHEDAEDWARRATEHEAFNPDAYLVLAASLGHLGRSQDARDALHDFESLNATSWNRTLTLGDFKYDKDIRPP